MKVPPPADLYALPALGPLLVLDHAAAIAANALRAQHAAIDNGFEPGEPDVVTTARVLATECDLLRDTLQRFRRKILDQLAHDRAAWPF